MTNHENIGREYRCPDCNKLLFKGILVDSDVEIKCKRCNELKIIKGEPGNKYICLVYPCTNRIEAKTNK
ncbi:MAG: hypothetical protein COT81_02430 [Candidatus Buchananbacteria bacterium CG10_big_fil_rev_8_21_14_0_10_42_9]|uniref:Com family DNA-binding transcriptional regulator n=1 Tax=Candidatus Buchananbacteria bacterium CG10_big_fil_rev_8_21_14_0_10_42_9 TaxID=1974526 RepID=A0A2H0W1E0_9BACT|nr:MAG: hypothetical protein COT81_02430 [Candidatus Buchananbacteria bacterium CG10_big_fil_rev_8_21_14_0_10_42_9]